MPWDTDLPRTRRRLASDLAGLAGRLRAAQQVARSQLLSEVGAVVAPARAAADAAMVEAVLGRTASGSEAWRRAIAPWDAWVDTALVVAQRGGGTAELVRVGTSEAARVAGESHTVPAMLPVLSRSNLLVAASGAELDAGHAILQGVMLRLLASLAPGQLRITAVDAMGLGAAFGDLLALERGIRTEVFHEERTVGEALTELTAHLSMGRQRLLRAEHATLAEYNAAAGELAEPWRVLLIAGFPTGFRPEVAERLATLMRNGPALGVSVLISVDTAGALPNGFVLADLERNAVVLRPSRGRWEATGKGVSFEFTADPRPPHALVNTFVNAWNRQVAEGGEVRVPLSSLLGGEPWTEDATDGLVVPLGRRAAGEPLLLRFGQRGTSHHALAGGRTGSGKTVLLHVLISALAHLYAPEEVGLYLVDFKEGVEFQVYRDLPHARVVAVQSEREFGLSVLEGLRAELNRRGERFREKGVDDLASWRRLTGEALPRLVLVVDEFQVFFEASDAVAHAARTLLSDLVSRGRGFGIHCVLASQTLSAMDLDARTLSQINVRLALQMSEVDSHKVLGKENEGAAALERPGQAIYNDGGGATASNVRFQVAFLDRAEREARVEALRRLRPGLRPIRFEGNRPATLEDDPRFASLLLNRPVLEPRAAELWLGEPTSVSETTGFLLRRQARANVIIVGADAASASVMLLTAAASALAQLPGARVRLLDLAPGEDVGAMTVAAAWARLGAEVFGPEAVEACLAAAHASLRERQLGARGSAELLVISGLQRARGLERASMKAPPALTLLLQLLSEGPDQGLHTLVWADTITAVQRTFAPAELAEFGGRVALVAGDATRVLGPSLSTLPALRKGYAWLAVDEDGDRARKLRCYGPETATWLATRKED